MTLEEKRNLFMEKFPGRLKFTGLKHPRIKQVLSIIKNTKSNPRNLVVVEGFWGVEKCLDKGLVFDAAFFSPELFLSENSEILAEKIINKSGEFDRCICSDKVFSRISEYKKPDGLLAVCEMPDYRMEDITPSGNSIYIVLDGVEIPGNIGTILRSCDGAGVKAVLICNRRARLTHPKVVKGSQGAVFSTPVIECDVQTAIDWFKKNNIKIVLTDTDAEKNYNEMTYKGNIAVVAGSERYGITREWYNHDDKRITIPMKGDCDSLNVAVSTSIIMYQISMEKNI